MFSRPFAPPGPKNKSFSLYSPLDKGARGVRGENERQSPLFKGNLGGSKSKGVGEKTRPSPTFKIGYRREALSSPISSLSPQHLVTFIRRFVEFYLCLFEGQH